MLCLEGIGTRLREEMKGSGLGMESAPTHHMGRSVLLTPLDKVGKSKKRGEELSFESHPDQLGD